MLLAYKLFRKLKNGDISPLFINKKLRLKQGVWYDAENHPTKGFAVRPGWHVTAKPHAPHLTKRGRVWKKVAIKDYMPIIRPVQQGGMWYLANKMKVLKDD